MLGQRSSARCAASAIGALLSVSSTLYAEEPNERREMTQEEMEKWLASEQEPKDAGELEEPEEAPPPPPRHHGFVVESSIGAFGYLGTLKNIAPTSPWFHLQFGYEPAK